VAGSAILAIKIIADAQGAIKEFDKLGRKTGGFEDAIGAAAIPAATIVTGLGAMTAAAAKDAGEQAKLQKIYETATGSTEDYSGAIDEAVKAGRAKAFTDTDVRKALQPLVIATGDAAKANEQLGPAMDIARLAGVDLEVAADALAKAHEGSARQLMALIPGLEKTKDPMDAVAQATALAAGQAETYAASAPGQLLAVSDAFLELGESIGSTFLPVLSTLTELASAAAGFLRQNMDVVQPLAVLFGILAVAILAVNGAMIVLGLLSSPVTLFIVGLLAIGAGLVMLYQRSQLFRDIVETVFNVGSAVVRTMGDAIVILGGVAQRVFDGIALVVGSVIDVIKGIFAGILAWMQDPFITFQEIAEGVFGAVQFVVEGVIGAVKLIFAGILAFFRQPFEDFQTIAETVFGVVQKAVETAIAAIALIFSKVQEMLEAPWKAFEETIRRIMETVKGIVQGAVDFINGILKGISDAVAGVAKTVDDINPFAVMPPAAGGTRSAFVPLGRSARGLGGASGGGSVVNVNVQSADPQEVMRAIRRWSRNNGGSGPFTRGLDRSTA
jgi:ElaB/YqjD/DUF883 family membrane-anchored ribosome-binding protein